MLPSQPPTPYLWITKRLEGDVLHIGAMLCSFNFGAKEGFTTISPIQRTHETTVLRCFMTISNKYSIAGTGTIQIYVVIARRRTLNYVSIENRGEQ